MQHARTELIKTETIRHETQKDNKITSLDTF